MSCVRMPSAQLTLRTFTTTGEFYSQFLAFLQQLTLSLSINVPGQSGSCQYQEEERRQRGQQIFSR